MSSVTAPKDPAPLLTSPGHPSPGDASAGADTRLEPPSLRRFSIHSRRYLGAKTRLLAFIDTILADEVGPFSSFADLFAGTGVVANHVNRPEVAVTTNDLLLSSVIPCRFFLTTRELDTRELEQRLQYLQDLTEPLDDYFSSTFGGTYFSLENAQHIGSIREQIDRWAQRAELTQALHDALLTSLLYAADKVAMTCGHYDAYRITQEASPPLELGIPMVNLENNFGNRVFQEDANHLIERLQADVIYLDPPYNSRQYSDTYHLLENLLSWHKPPVFGQARKMDRRHLKSRFSSPVQAGKAMAALIAGADCRYLLISYNNMARKGDMRSNACIPDEVFLAALQARGDVQVFEQPFQPFSAGLRTIEAHTERIFCCRVTTPPTHRGAS